MKIIAKLASDQVTKQPVGGPGTGDAAGQSR